MTKRILAFIMVLSLFFSGSVGVISKAEEESTLGTGEEYSSADVEVQNVFENEKDEKNTTELPMEDAQLQEDVSDVQVGAWYKNSQGWWYRNPDGTYPANCWAEINNNWYNFNADGYMRTGWYIVGSNRYYLHPSSGIMQTGWQFISGKWYYFMQGGEVAKYWFKLYGSWYYANSEGCMQTGWIKGSGVWYYCHPSSGKMYSNAWAKVGGYWYYFDLSGVMYNKGWLQLGSNWYYIKSDGKMAQGFVKSGTATYYCEPSSGIMQRSTWVRAGNNWYYVDDGGAMKTGWLQYCGKWYFLRSNGAMAQGWVKSGAAWYYCEPGSGIMQRSTWVYVGNNWYYVDGGGAMKTGWLQYHGNQYYLQSNGVMAKNTYLHGYIFDANGVCTKGVKLGGFTTYSTNGWSANSNMALALSRMNNYVVRPGEVFSFAKATGPWTSWNGYQVAAVVGGMGVGGGVCQASTTLYGAVIRSGLQIYERRNHSVPSTYVPIGLDAMVASGYSDFKFRNNSSAPIIIKAGMSGNTLWIDIYGVQSTWYDSVKPISWHTSSRGAAAIRIFYKNGKEVYKENLPSSYY